MTDPSPSDLAKAHSAATPATAGVASGARPYTRSRLTGGPNGASFAEDLTRINRLAGFRVYDNIFLIEGFQALWSLPGGGFVEGEVHGSGGSNPREEVRLERDEYLVRAEIATDNGFISSLAFISNRDRRFGTYGYFPEPRQTIETGPIYGFFGRSADFLNALGFFSRPVISEPGPPFFPPYLSSPQYGGDNGEEFSDNLTEIARIRYVRINAGAYVNSIQLIWELPDRTNVEGVRHGGPGGTASFFAVALDEFIERIDVGAGTGRSPVDCLTFYTTRGTKHGPYGNVRGPQNRISGGPINGFHGRAGDLLYRIGAFRPQIPETPATAGAAA